MTGSSRAGIVEISTECRNGCDKQCQHEHHQSMRASTSQRPCRRASPTCGARRGIRRCLLGTASGS